MAIARIRMAEVCPLRVGAERFYCGEKTGRPLLSGAADTKPREGKGEEK
jgi:hypothetical protein